MSLTILILGAGITGLTSALALYKHLPEPKPNIKIIELRPALGSIGGAVNLTPKALRYLDHIGVWEKFVRDGIGAQCKVIDLYDLYTGQRFAEVAFQTRQGHGIGHESGRPFYARRVMRWQIQRYLLDAVEALPGSEVTFGKDVIQINEDGDNGVTLEFSDGTHATGDVLLSCDGIHSAGRTLLVDPLRTPKYTGIAVAQSIAVVDNATQLPWDTTALVSSRKGSLLMSYFDNSTSQQYVAAVMEIDNVDTHDGWKARASQQLAVRQDILDRYRSDAMPQLTELLANSGDWFLYPVHALPFAGKWISPKSRVILLGDAAHAMPPQGESTGICIEDAIIFSRAMMHHKSKSFESIFHAYDNFRRPKVEAAHKQATQRFENVKDKGWLAHQMLKILTPWILWWTEGQRQEDFAEDLTGLEMDFS